MSSLEAHDFDMRHLRTASLSGPIHSGAQRESAVIQQRLNALGAYLGGAGSNNPGAVKLVPNRFGLPKIYTSRNGALTGPSQQNPELIARDFLRQNAAIFRLSEAEVTGLRLVRRIRSAGAVVFHFNQSLNGVDVYGGHVRVVLGGRGQVIQAGVGDVIPGLGLATEPRLDPEQAALAALASHRLAAERLEPLPEKEPRKFLFRNPISDSFTPIQAELTIFPVTASAARLAYRVFLEADLLDWCEILIDAENGDLLLRQNLYRSIAQARVWKKSPVAGERELVDLPEGWLPPGGTVTTGNNVDAFLDVDGDGQPETEEIPDLDQGRASSETQLFDFPAAEGSTGQDPRELPAASVTNLFYFANEAHDYFYDLGFDEQAGNFQADNFGRGGVENDAVRATARHGFPTNNASFARVPEGIQPRLVMGLFDSGTLFDLTDDRDSSFSAQVVIHEYGHGVTTRIVGGPDDVSCLSGVQSDGLQEGWADYFSNSYTDDPVQGAYLTQNSERGVRRQSYDGYSFTYEDIGNDGFDRPHDEGEIWAATLWDLRNELGAETIDQLTLDGLKLTPCGPTMIDARDGVLMAEQTINGNANRAKLWEVFARHGMGNAAGGRHGSILTGTVFNAAFDLPPDLQPGNRTPTATSEPPLAMGVGSSYVYTVSAVDPDSDPLTYELTEAPPGMTLNATTRRLEWTANFTGARAKVTVSDLKGGDLKHGFLIPVLTILQPGVPVTIDGPTFSVGLAGFVVPVGTQVLQVTLRGGAGDPDLVLFTSDFLANSFRPGSNETISLAAPPPGAWGMRVEAFEAYGDVSLEVAFPEPTEIEAGTDVPDLRGDESSETFFRLEVPPNSGSLRISTRGGAGDVDLLVSQGGVPVCQLFVDYDCIFDLFSENVGNEESVEIIDPQPGSWFINLNGFGAYSGVTLTAELDTVEPVRPIIFNAGVALATQTPLVAEIAPNAIITVAGEQFAPPGTFAIEPMLDEDGKVSTRLADTCLEIEGERSPVYAVLPGQINAQATHLLNPGDASAVVIRGCGTGNEQRSDPVNVTVTDVSPAFFNFINHLDGRNPIAALHGGGPALVGAPGLLPGAEFTPAEPGEFISLFGTGFGPTDPALSAGEIPLTVLPELTGQARLTNDVSVTIGGIPVPPEDVFYAGIAPCCAGLYQLVVKVPPTAPNGDLGVILTVDSVSTPEGPFVTVEDP